MDVPKWDSQVLILKGINRPNENRIYFQTQKTAHNLLGHCSYRLMNKLKISLFSRRQVKFECRVPTGLLKGDRQ